MTKLKSRHIGLFTGGAMAIALLFSFYILKMPVESNFQLLVYSIFTAGIIWSLLAYHRVADRKNAFKDYFAAGFRTFVIVSLLMAVYTFVFFSFNIGFRDAKIAENNRLIIAEGNHLPAEIEENARQLRRLFMPMMVSGAIFRYLITGALISAAGSAFLTREKKDEALITETLKKAE